MSCRKVGNGGDQTVGGNYPSGGAGSSSLAFTFFAILLGILFYSEHIYIIRKKRAILLFPSSSEQGKV